MIHTKKNILMLASLFVMVFLLAYSLLVYDKNTQINATLQEHLKYLQISYKQALDRFKIISDNVYVSMQNDEVLLDILDASNKVNESKRKELRDTLYKHLENEFNKLRMLEVTHLQIITLDNHSLLRMHQSDKYGDDLSEVRHGVEYANTHKVFVSGFEEGKTTHAFRHVYPIYKEGTHIGAIDIGFSSTMVQSYTMRASDIHTHFIVNKNVFKTNMWQSDIQEQYYQSIEHEDFYFNMSGHMNHDVLNISKINIINPLRETINEKIASGKEFVVYKELPERVKIVAFLPIQNIKKDKTVAYLISYADSEHIAVILLNFKIATIITLLVVFFAFFIVYKAMSYCDRLKDELRYDALMKIYNKKYFLLLAKQELLRAQRYKNVFSIVMADIDHFKNINDAYGHQTGDLVLEELSNTMHSSIRELDTIARYGGEEFILLIIADEENSREVIEKIRKKIEESSFGKNLKLKITVSFGIAQYKDDLTLQEIIERADKALYISKNEGRNRITLG